MLKKTDSVWRTSRTLSGPGRHSLRPTLEALEDRLTPSTYDLVNLGTMSVNPEFVYVEDVNSNGIVVGISRVNDPVNQNNQAFIIVPKDTNGDGKADQWNVDEDNDGLNDLMQELKTVSDVVSSSAFAINQLGQVVGRYYTRTDPSSPFIGQAFLITPEDTDGDGAPDSWYRALSENNADNALLTNLGTLGGDSGAAYDINNQGQVVGVAGYTDGFDYPFLWNPDVSNGTTGTMIHLGALGEGSYSVYGYGARSINEVGQIAGVTKNSEGQRRGFVITPQDADGDGVFEWRNDDATGANTLMRDLGALETGEPFYGSQAFAINDGGIIVGEADSSISIAWGHAVRWDQQPDGSYEINDLGGLHGTWYHSAANDVNSHDVIVGHSQKMVRSTHSGKNWLFEPIGEERAYVIDGGNMQPLDELVSSLEGFDTLNSALAISDNGHIVGLGMVNGEQRAFIAVPMITDPQLSIDDVSQTEGDSGTTIFTFTVTRSGDVTIPLYVDFTTIDGTATLADNDYEFATGTLFFDAGETTQTITIVVLGDTDEESDETFTVQLSSPTDGATIVDGLGEGTIIDDDGSGGGKGNGKGNGKPKN